MRRGGGGSIVVPQDNLLAAVLKLAFNHCTYRRSAGRISYAEMLIGYISIIGPTTPFLQLASFRSLLSPRLRALESKSLCPPLLPHLPYNPRSLPYPNLGLYRVVVLQITLGYGHVHVQDLGGGGRVGVGGGESETEG